MVYIWMILSHVRSVYTVEWRKRANGMRIDWACEILAKSRNKKNSSRIKFWISAVLRTELKNTCIKIFSNYSKQRLIMHFHLQMCFAKQNFFCQIDNDSSNYSTCIIYCAVKIIQHES